MLTTFSWAGTGQGREPDATVVSLPAGSSSEGQLVAILLSTFNGRKFINQQLYSYLSQTWHDWHLYWRDDGSTDESVGRINAFAAGAGHGRCIHDEQDAHLGASGSFFALLRTALTGKAMFFAFSDQDDVWLP